MYRFEILFRNILLCRSDEYEIRGQASAIARNYVYRLEQEWKRVKYKYKLSEFRIRVINEIGVNVYDVQLR